MQPARNSDTDELLNEDIDIQSNRDISGQSDERLFIDNTSFTPGDPTTATTTNVATRTMASTPSEVLHTST